MQSGDYRLLGLLMVATVLAGGVLEALGEVPDLLTAKEREHSTWLSLATVTSGGAMRWEMFSKEEREYIRRQVGKGRKSGRGIRAGTCLSSGPFYSEVPVFETLSETVEDSVAIYVGTVTDAKIGFVGGNLGTLYELSVERDLKSGTAVPLRVLVFYGVAEAEVDGVRMCPPGYRGGVRPVVGGRLLLFGTEAMLAEPVLRPYYYHSIFETATGDLSVPSNLGDLTNLDLELSLIVDWIEGSPLTPGPPFPEGDGGKD